MEELVINIWIYIDLPTGMGYAWSGKIYSLTGSDDNKFKILEALAESDYKTVPRKQLTDRVSITENGVTTTGVIPSANLNDYFEKDSDWFCEELEKELPNVDVYTSVSNDSINKPQKLSQNPLYLLTRLFENEKGEVKPFTSEENIKWIKNELKRINNS